MLLCFLPQRQSKTKTEEDGVVENSKQKDKGIEEDSVTRFPEPHFARLILRLACERDGKSCL